MKNTLQKLSKIPGKDLIAITIVILITIPIFEYWIQPILVSIDPMFADRYGSSNSSGRYPTTPSGLALWGTGMVLLVIYGVFEYKIGSYLSDEETDGN